MCWRRKFFVSAGLLTMVVLATVLMATTFLATALGSTRTPNSVVSAVQGCAGTTAAGGGVIANGTAGQPGAIGMATGGGLVLYGGFWGPCTSSLTPVETPDAALRTELQANYPNPFNPQTRINFALAAPVRVRLDVFDARGQLVRVLLDETRLAGRQGVVWDGTDNDGRRVSSGLYFARLRAGDYDSVRKMTVVK